MKDGNKTISEKATWFLPVDMKDRLKAAFNRNSSTTTPENAPADDALDHGAIFTGNRSAANEKNPRVIGPIVGGPADQTRLGEPPNSVTARYSSRQIAPDIEEAEIVADPGDEVVARSASEAALLKTRKSEAEAWTFARNSAKQDYNPQPELEAKYDTSKNGEAEVQKSKSRLFGDFASTESVRLKVEKRNDKSPAPTPIPLSDHQPARPDPMSAEVSVLKTEPDAASVFALDAEPLEPPVNGRHATTEGVAAETAISERSHINLLEEYDSMDAKGHESVNGAMVGTDGGSGGAAIAIERNSKFSGQLRFSGAVTIDGQVEGALVADRIVVNEGGVVTASVEGHVVVIAGTVKGDVCAHSELEILPSGIVDGSVTAPAITVRRGGRVEGLCAIGVRPQ